MVSTAMQPSPDESEPDKNDRPWWRTRFLWTSVGMVKAGWMTKDGSGVWAVTPAGRQALDQYPDPNRSVSLPTTPTTSGRSPRSRRSVALGWCEAHRSLA